jgi:hypothetical protein
MTASLTARYLEKFVELQNTALAAQIALRVTFA